MGSCMGVLTMDRWRTRITLAAAVASLCLPACAQGGGDTSWQEAFDLSSCTMQPEGKGRYFILEPGFQTVLEGGDTKVQITVLEETRPIAGVITRVVEEREWKDGELYEVSRNYFAMCGETRDAYYFGEDVDYYDNGKVVRHDGAWLAGENGNRPGLIMAGSPKPAMRYYQEFAPGVAMDRAEVVSLDETCETPAGTFSNCLKVKEGSALDPSESEYKYYAPNVGLVQDEDLKLIRYHMSQVK
jgi:hypothetical protein